jgi:hypothetical protein
MKGKAHKGKTGSSAFRQRRQESFVTASAPRSTTGGEPIV